MDVLFNICQYPVYQWVKLKPLTPEPKPLAQFIDYVYKLTF